MAGYGGRIIDNSQGIKQFFYFDPNSGPQVNAWYYTTIGGDSILTPSNRKTNVLIKNDLIVEGNIIVTSDRRLKEHISEIPKERTDGLMDLHPVSFSYINDEAHSSHFGFLAQEVESVFPELVKDVSPEHKAVNYIEVIPLLVSKIKEMQEEINQLKNKVSMFQKE